MKLLPLLYTSEARTPEETLVKGIVAVRGDKGRFDASVSLVDTGRFLGAVAKAVEHYRDPGTKQFSPDPYSKTRDVEVGYGRSTAEIEAMPYDDQVDWFRSHNHKVPELDHSSDEDRAHTAWFVHHNKRLSFASKIGFDAANRALVGTVSFNPVAGCDDLFKVGISAGVNKFGPLAYQLVMASVFPGWLKSDNSLRSGSAGVWNKMYDLSNSGVYERRWLGDFEPDAAANGMALDDTLLYYAAYAAPNSGKLHDYLSDIESDESNPDRYSERFFLNWIAKRGITPNQFGHMWAYRKPETDPKIQDMFQGGEQLLGSVAAKYGLDEDIVRLAVKRASGMFFDRMYK